MKSQRNDGARKKACRVLLLFIVAILFLVAGCGVQQFKSPLYQLSDNEGQGPAGLTWNGHDLIIGDGRQLLELSTIETGTFFSADSPYNNDGYFSFAREAMPFTKPAKICGLAWEGECCGKGFLWIADSLNKEILKTTPSFDIVRRIPSPGDSPRGLVFDGKDLWVGDSKTSKIHRVSPKSGEVLGEFNSPIKDLTGLAWDCANIWVVGMDSCKTTVQSCYVPRLVKLDVQSGRVTREADLPSQIVRPSSLVWVDGVMWVADSSLNRVFKLTPREHDVNDQTVYTSEITVTPPEPRKIPARMTLPGQESKSSAEEAKEAAEQAKKSAKEAQEAAEQAKKAFELQQVK